MPMLNVINETERGTCEDPTAHSDFDNRFDASVVDVMHNSATAP